MSIDTSGMAWHLNKPETPAIGDCYYDESFQTIYIWTGTQWQATFASPPADYIDRKFLPTKEQLDNHPALNRAWDEYLVIRKLLGL